MPVSEPNEGYLADLWEAVKGRAQQNASMLTPDDDQKELTPDEVDLLWDTRAMPLEQEWDLHRQRNPDGTPTYSREQVGQMVYPHRERLAKMGGRVEPRQWITWANRQAKRMEAKRAANAPPALPDPTMTPHAPPTVAGPSRGGADYG